MNPSTDWKTPLLILSAAIILGGLFVVFFNSRRRSAAASPFDRDLERKDLEHKRDALVAQLRALPDDAIDERARLETETADVLRRLDGMGAVSAGAPAQSPAMNPFVKGFFWGAGSCAAMAALLLFVYQKMTPRAEGDVMTGGITSPQQQQQPAQGQMASDPMVQQLEAAVQRDPNNNELRLNLAQVYLERDNLMGVFEQTRVVLEREPRNPRALTFGALVRMAMGEADTAEQMLTEATAIDPQNLDSRVALAWVYAQTNRMDKAENAIAEAVKVSPVNKARLEDVLAQMKANAGQQQQAQSMPADHPPVGSAPAGNSVKITLQLDPAARAKNGIVFVVARPLSGGPPVAVKRMQVAQFPVTFDLSSADSMMGQPLPDKFRLEARLDSDGDASTKPPTDPAAAPLEVASGAAVTLALK